MHSVASLAHNGLIRCWTVAIIRVYFLTFITPTLRAAKKFASNSAIPRLGCTKRLVDGTVLVVGACGAYWELDGQTSVAARFLKSQIYPDGVSNLTGYTLTFDLYGIALARIVIPDGPILADLDLADLYGHPWHQYKRVGYNRLYITHTDWGEINPSELKELESQVLQDIRYDFPEDEVDLWFETSLDATSLMVALQDIDDED